MAFKDILNSLNKEEEPIMSKMTSPTPIEDYSKAMSQDPVLFQTANPPEDYMQKSLEDANDSSMDIAPQMQILNAPSATNTDSKSLIPTQETDFQKLESKLQELRDLDAARESTASKYNFGAKAAAILGDAISKYQAGTIQKNVGVPIQHTGPTLQQLMGIIGEVKAPSTAEQKQALIDQYKQLALNQRAQAKLTSKEKTEKENRLHEKELENIKASGKGKLTPYQQLMEDRYQEKATKLSDKQTSEIEGLDNALKALDEVEVAKSGVNTGRYASAFQAGKDIIPGMEADPDFVALRQLAGTQLFDYVKAQSGVSYSAKELQQLKNNMPNEDDDDNTFMTKLNTVRKIIERKRQTKLGAFKKQGKNVKEFKQEQPEESKKEDVFPKTVTNKKTKETAIVENEQELKEALAEGFE